MINMTVCGINYGDLFSVDYNGLAYVGTVVNELGRVFDAA